MAKNPEKKEAGQKVTPRRAEGAPSRFMNPWEEMERMFERFMGRPAAFPARMRQEWPFPAEFGTSFEMGGPKVDIIDRDDEVVLKAEVPGVKREDLDVSLTENTVTIKGSTRHEEKVEKGDYYRSEISRGSFARTVGLPANVDGERTKASFKDGVLELVMPKVTKATRRTIKVE